MSAESRYPPQEALRDAFSEHRPHVGLAAGLFALGTLLGVALYLGGVSLLELFIELIDEELLLGENGEELELTATFFIVHNTQPFLLSIAGALTLGILTAAIMLFNGVILGNVGAAMADIAGIDFVIVGIAPHGIFELTALFLAAAIGFRLVHRFGQRAVGTRDAFVTRRYLYRTGLLVVVAWLLLVVAAFLEAYLTPYLLEEFFGARLESMNEGQ